MSSLLDDWPSTVSTDTVESYWRADLSDYTIMRGCRYHGLAVRAVRKIFPERLAAAIPGYHVACAEIGL